MRIATALTSLVLLAACAQVRELQGGKKDVEPPVLLAADPPNGSVRFAGDRIILHFDERVKLDRVRERLLVSPPLERLPEVVVNGSSGVVIMLRSPLAPNTTYTFNIGESVVDITEGNPAEGTTYVCSTGDVLDSLSVNGIVLNAFTAEAEAGMQVMLHADTDTTAFTAGRPAYFTRTDKAGRFVIGHLRDGRFALHALRDQNANYRYDLPNEGIAFHASMVTAGDTVRHVLYSFRELAPTQQVREALVQTDRGWRLVLSRPSSGLNLASIDRTGGSLTWRQEWNYARDTVVLWPSDTTLLDDQRFEVADTSGVIDTVTYRVQRKMPFNLDVRHAGIEGERLSFLATRPVQRIRQDRIRLHIDSTVITTAEVLKLLEIDTLWPRRLTLTLDPALDRSVLLELLPGAVEDIYGGTNDSLRIAIGGRKLKESGSLRVDLVADSMEQRLGGPFLFQLLNGQGSVVRTERITGLPHRFESPELPAATYSLKLIADTDDDGRWSTGSLRDRRQPERVFRRSEEVNVRAGWEVAVEWIVR